MKEGGRRGRRREGGREEGEGERREGGGVVLLSAFCILHVCNVHILTLVYITCCETGCKNCSLVSDCNLAYHLVLSGDIRGSYRVCLKLWLLCHMM